MTPIRLLRTSSFRLTGLYALIFLASAGTLFSIVYWTARSALRDQLAMVSRTEAEGLAAEYRLVGADDVSATIEQRLKLRARNPAYYLLQDQQGRVIAGNLTSILPTSGLIEMDPPESSGQDADDPEEAEYQIIAYGIILANEGFLLVGQDTYSINEAEEAMIRSFGVTAVVALVFAVAGGAILSAGFLRRIDAINRTSRAIVDGQLEKRIPLLGADDEMDRLAASLNEMLDRIMLLMESLRQVSSDIAHDLRTPLGRLRQRLEATRAGSRTAIEYEAAVDAAITEVDAILDTFAALLRIAQIESGARRAGFRTLDLSALFRFVAETYAAVAEENGHGLAVDIQPGVTIDGDRDLLVQMLANLIENAIKHTPAGTTVLLKLASVPGTLTAMVADNGLGIPASARDKVFRRFYRLDKSRASPGNGLGLALVAAIADLHRIMVHLEDNEPGLRVTLTFPSRRAA